MVSPLTCNDADGVVVFMPTLPANEFTAIPDW
jgi:hypothetical protein